ncbi:MAG: hypothetical protein PVJ86_12530 [Phycisphaerales bacterium]|jgi:hypothetical protein
MRTNKSLLAVTATIVCCAVAVWFSTSIQGSQKTYELRPQVTIPQYKTEVARVVDAYERLMERYMDITERDAAMVGMDLRNALTKLDSISHKLTELSARIAGIEKALGIEQPKKLTGKSLRTKTDGPGSELGVESPK